jgi:polysaccharide deacetylase domain protein
MAHSKGHEIGSHGLTHEVSQAIDILPRRIQLEHLATSKKILEEITGEEVISFRAPAARVDKKFCEVLKEAGYKIDSSVSSQRLDMFLSFGSLKKLNWITAPRKAYFTREDNIFRRGDSPIFEIPISALGFPYIGTFMRISPALNRLTRRMLYWETLANGRQFNFLTHPNEFIDEDRETDNIQRRADNYIAYLLGDVLRHRLKVKNLGNKAIPILEKELQFFKNKEFRFITCKDLYLTKK